MNNWAKIHDCGEWSNWLTFEDLTEEMINNYEIILNNDSNEICNIFSLEQYIQQEEIKGFKMSIIKTAGIASCLGLTLAIGAILIYSKMYFIF
uniref:Uncharacterized protein n=1 Tax=Theileria annulata TaxID=5874 RepID=A0A3B0MXG0_THEAN